MVSAKRKVLIEAGIMAVIRDAPERKHPGYSDASYVVFKGFLHGRRKHNLSASSPGRSLKGRRSKSRGSGGRGGRHAG